MAAGCVVRVTLIKMAVPKQTNSACWTSLTSHLCMIINTPFSSLWPHEGTNHTHTHTAKPLPSFCIFFVLPIQNNLTLNCRLVLSPSSEGLRYPSIFSWWGSMILIKLWPGYKTVTNGSFRWGNETDSFSSSHQSKPSTSLCIHCTARPTFSPCWRPPPPNAASLRIKKLCIVLLSDSLKHYPETGKSQHILWSRHCKKYIKRRLLKVLDYLPQLNLPALKAKPEIMVDSSKAL